jgi:hypothetical protein
MAYIYRRWSRRSRPELPIRQWRERLVPTEVIQVSRPLGLRHSTYRHLVNEYNRVLDNLAALPRRRLWSGMRRAYEHQFLNRIVHIRGRDPRRREALGRPGLDAGGGVRGSLVRVNRYLRVAYADDLSR